MRVENWCGYDIRFVDGEHPKRVLRIYDIP